MWIFQLPVREGAGDCAAEASEKERSAVRESTGNRYAVRTSRFWVMGFLFDFLAEPCPKCTV
jgi:hypothetical protein